MLLQVDVSKWESALGPGQVGAGPSIYASPLAPLPCHGFGARGEHTIAAGFPYTPDSWSSASATALACSDDGCGATMAQHSAAQQATSNLTGVNSGLAILSSLFTRTNFHIEDTLLGAYNVMSFGAPKIWSEHLFPAACLSHQDKKHVKLLCVPQAVVCSSSHYKLLACISTVGFVQNTVAYH